MVKYEKGDLLVVPHKILNRRKLITSATEWADRNTNRAYRVWGWGWGCYWKAKRYKSSFINNIPAEMIHAGKRCIQRSTNLLSWTETKRISPPVERVNCFTYSQKDYKTDCKNYQSI
jgi:hypothetical protein